MKIIIIAFLIIICAATATYDKSSASSWAQGCAHGCSECPDDSSCGCTYFTTHALTHGSWGGGYIGVCATLWSNFKSGKYSGWKNVGTSETSVSAGDAVIMNNGHDGDASHCCVGTGKGVITCHNPGALNVAPHTTWYSGGYINAIYSYSGAATSSDSEKADEEDHYESKYSKPQSEKVAGEISVPPPATNSSSTDLVLSDTVISCGAYQSDACNCVYYARDCQPKLPSGLSTCDDKKSKVNSHTAAAGCVLFRTGDPTYCHAAYVTKVSGGVVYYDQVITNCIVHFNIFLLWINFSNLYLC